MGCAYLITSSHHRLTLHPDCEDDLAIQGSHIDDLHRTLKNRQLMTRPSAVLLPDLLDAWSRLCKQKGISCATPPAYGDIGYWERDDDKPRKPSFVRVCALADLMHYPVLTRVSYVHNQFDPPPLPDEERSTGGGVRRVAWDMRRGCVEEIWVINKAVEELVPLDEARGVASEASRALLSNAEYLEHISGRELHELVVGKFVVLLVRMKVADFLL
jgi:hypothetical protein